MKSDNKDKQDKIDISGKTEKIDVVDNKEKEVQLKKDNDPDKNQKSEKILKEDEKMSAEKNNKANDKVEKVDKPEKTNKDDKKEEKGGKSMAKSPTGNSGKTLHSPDSKGKVGHPRLEHMLITHCCGSIFALYRLTLSDCDWLGGRSVDY